MCGRFTLRTKPTDVAKAFDVDPFAMSALGQMRPRYNVAPTQQVLIFAQDRTPQWARWGLIPSWAQDEKIGNSLINARAETVADKPAFRSAFKRRRCLVVADGFYEWRKVGGEKSKAKQPFFIRLRDGRPFAFAGLFERWSKGEKPVDSCTIITTDPNPLMATIHDRMPVILPPEAYDRWLDPEFEGREQLAALLKSYSADAMQAEPIGTFVNNPRNEGPECLPENGAVDS